MDKQGIIALIEDKREKFIAASDQIWETPELRFDTKKSVQEHHAILETEDFSIESGVAHMGNAYVATYGSGKPVIGILGEYDALSNLSQVADHPEEKPLINGGNGHGCGHNLLGTGALAGAVGIKEYLKKTGLQGTIKLFGCPAEEGGGGKAYMAREGLFDDLDIALTWHPDDYTHASGSSSLAVWHVYFHFTGTSAHAAGAPEMGRSALDAAELTNIGVQYLREHIIDEARIHYAYKDTGGTSPNVVPSSSSLFYYVRAPKMEQAAEIYERVSKIAQGAALMTDTKLTIELDSACYNYIPNKILTSQMHENLKILTPLDFTPEEIAYEQQFFDTLPEVIRERLFKRASESFPEKTLEELKAIALMPVNPLLFPLAFPDKTAISTDMGDVSWVVPSARINVACEPQGASAHSWQWVANGKSAVAHKGLLTAGKAIALTAYDLLNHPELIEQAREEHLQTLNGKTYVCAIPSEIMPEK